MPSSFDFNRVVQATENVRNLLLLATRTFESSGISYALTDDNAVAAWVAIVDESAVRNTPEVTLLVNRHEFEDAAELLIEIGLLRSPNDTKLFVQTLSSRHGVHLFAAGGQIAQCSAALHPDPAQSQKIGPFRVLSLKPLVEIKLSTFRDRDRLNLRDLIDVGLLDQTWPARFPGELASRLQLLLDTPGG